ncbi:MAG: sensor histidine kinase [Candidatus Bipolaricaulis sp.]|nr:sensor histidine kinase [Candidatus Bipolaricaulis sp.]
MNGAAGFAERKAGVVRTILVRRLTLGVFSAVALVVLFTSRLSYRNPLFYSPVVWFLLTFPFKAGIERIRSERGLQWAHAGFFFAEAVLITILVHFMGGSAWSGNIFYLFTVLYANYFLPRTQGALVTGWVVVCYAALVLLEAAGVVPHRSLFAVGGEPYQSLSYNLATILAGAVALYSVVAFTVRTFAAIDAKKNRLLAERELELARMSKRLLNAQDEERRRIARGLHDGLSQSLAAIKLHLAPAKSKLGEDAYREVSGIVDEAIRQTRTLAYSIRPPLLDDLGLVPSLERLAESVGEESGLAIRVHADLDGRLDREAEGLLYHVGREAIENVIRHAKATRVAIRISAEGTWVRLSIEDDGIGIAPDGPRGLGLRGIEERVTIAGGTVALASAPERGTIVTVEVPCGDDADCDRR